MSRYTLLIMAACTLIAADAPDTPIDKEVKRLAIPNTLMPKGQQPLFIVRADGVQIYMADANLAWQFQAPKATLRDYRTGAEVGSHSKGPLWADAKGSALTGKGVVKVTASDNHSPASALAGDCTARVPSKL